LKLLKVKRSEPVSLTAGVLIIGSLFWDSEKERPAWRASRLDVAAAQAVTAPIRYGRLSESRGNSYTMVFSRLCPAGQAKLVPCSHRISTVQDLIAEAEHLWTAEQPTAKAHRIASTWGCVALLCNPDRQIPGDLSKGWAEHVGSQIGYGNVSQTMEEGALVSPDGLLHINWPRLLEGGAAADVDLLLVTANDPEIAAAAPSYPTPAAIAQAWNRAGKYVEYFWKNIDNGIFTFEDAEIRKLLRRRDEAGV
jgi:hypothetical protein